MCVHRNAGKIAGDGPRVPDKKERMTTEALSMWGGGGEFFLFFGGGKKIWEGGRKIVLGKDVSGNRARINYLTIRHCQFLGSLFFRSFSGYMLNLCTVALQLCESFLLSKGKGKYKQIEAQYCTSKGCRLRFDNERTMGGGNIGK